jgi:O-antigen ligase
MSATLRDRAGLAGALLLIAAPALLPYHAEPLPAFYQDWLAFVFGLIAAVPVLMPRRGESIPVPWMALGLSGLAAVLALQVALGRVTFIESSVTGILYAAWAGLLVVTGARLREIFGPERTAFVLQCAFAAGGFLLAITGFMQVYHVAVGGFEILAASGSGIVGAVGQRNYFTNIVACALASLLALAASGKARLPIAALAGIPMIFALALSDSRSVWLFAAIILVCAIFARERRLFMLSAAAVALLVAAAWAIEGGGASRTVGTLMATEAGTVIRSDAQRAALALYAWHVFLAHPVLGAGWGELAWNAFMLAPDLAVSAPAPIDKHSHNLALQLLAETGIAGAACVLVPLAFWFWRRLRRRLPLDCDAWIVTIAAIHLAQAMVELPHWYAYLLGPFALVLGLGAGDAMRAGFAGWPRFASGALLAAVVAVAALRMTDYRALEQWTAEAAALQRTGRPLPPALLARLERLDASVFAPEVELIAAQIQTGPDLDAQLALNTRAMHAFPLPALAAQRVRLLRLAGRPEEAEAVSRSIYAVWGLATRRIY